MIVFFMYYKWFTGVAKMVQVLPWPCFFVVENDECGNLLARVLQSRVFQIHYRIWDATVGKELTHRQSVLVGPSIAPG